MYRRLLFIITIGIVLTSCGKEDGIDYEEIPNPYANIKAAFGNNIDPDNLYNYANQFIPSYVGKDNSAANPVTDKGATLGRVLFYDKNLSSNTTVSCSSCHKQAHAFSDNVTTSTGVAGNTVRHPMRLINTRFALETKFFWDERAASLEAQSTMPIRDHAEMGFSGQNGDFSFDDLVTRLSGIGYYKELFRFVYGSEEITEQKIQLALSQFINSIQSFDSKYDAGRAGVNADNMPFANFTSQENLGKALFLAPPVFNESSERISGGAGCAGCHMPPEFDIDPNSLNNGVIGVINSVGRDLTNTRAPSLRDIVKVDGKLNGPLMHTAEFNNLLQVIEHYNIIGAGSLNKSIDPRLTPGGRGQQLLLTEEESDAIISFLLTLSGTNVYTDPRWSDPFLTQ